MDSDLEENFDNFIDWQYTEDVIITDDGIIEEEVEEYNKTVVEDDNKIILSLHDCAFTNNVKNQDENNIENGVRYGEGALHNCAYTNNVENHKNNIENEVRYEEEGLDKEGQVLLKLTRKQRKWREMDPINTWIKPHNKRRREQGLDYEGLQFEVEEGKKKWRFTAEWQHKELKPRCNCKPLQRNRNLECHKITDNDRQKLHEEFWNVLTWEEKKLYITNSVVKKTTACTRDWTSEDES